MATDTDRVASRAAALRLAQQMGCSGAHQHPDGKWMPCATMTEYEELVKKDKKNTVRVVEQRRRSRNSKGKNKRDWEPLAQRGLTSIDTITGGGLVGGRGGSIKSITPWAPDDEDPDVFTTPRLARRRSRQLGCIGIARRVSRNGNTVWTPCSNATDYAKRTGSTAFGRNFQRRRARRTLDRAVAREVRRQLGRKKSLMEELYEGKALGRKLNRARVALTTPFNRDARDADLDMLVQEGTPWERPATPRVPGLRSRRDGPIGGWRFGPKVTRATVTRATGRRLAGRRIASRIDPAQIPENVPGDENFWDNHRLMERLTELAGYAQFEKLRRANDKLPLPKNPKNIQDGERLKPYQLARQVEPLLGIDPITGNRFTERGVPDGDFELRPIHRYDGARRFVWGNNSEVPTEMEHLPDEVLDRISRDALAEFDRRQETERLRLLERGEEFEPEWYVRGLASRRSEGLTAGPVGPTEQGGIDSETGRATGRHLGYREWVRDRRQQRSGRRRAERSADRDQRRRDMEDQRAYAADMEDPRVNPPVTEAEINAMAQHYEKEKDQRAFERDMADLNINPPVTEAEIDEMAEYYDFAEATGGLKSVRGFKLTEEEETNLSFTEKAAKYRKATLDAVGEEHRGKPVRRVHWVYGAPGSGKTAKTRLGHLRVPDTSEAAHTNPDDYKRFHPLWNGGRGAEHTHQPSRGESAQTLHAALDEGMDVVVQGTGKDGILMNSILFPDRDYRNGRRSDTASIMHYLHVADLERARRIFDRGRRDTPATGQRQRDQRKRVGAEPKDAMNVLDQVVKYIEEGRVDETHIYDNSGPLDETPPLVATFKDGNLVIYDEEKFDEIFNPKDHNGQPAVFRGPVADRPRVTAYSERDDPRRGKTYAERLREEGENPGGFRKWDEARREKAIREHKNPASYRGMHTAPTKSEEGGDTLDSLTNMLPLQEGENNRIRVRVYGSSDSDPEYAKANDEMLEILDAVTGKPDEMITVYRAVPSSRDASENDQINPGDWVSPSPTYAAIHGEGPLRGEYDIVETRVRAGDLVSEGNSLYEFGFDPDPTPEPSGPLFEEGESLQSAYRRHLKAKGIQTDGERAFEEQYGYELRSGDGDCYSASYRAAVELAEKGVDADGDPVTNVRVVVGSPVFPKVGERSGHAWVEYDAVKPPPPLMSSADRDHAKEQILALVEDMDLPPGRKQETIDSFLEAIDRANAANAAAPVRDVTMVRDYASVRDGDDILEFDDMDRGRLEALKPDVERDVYYRAGEMEEVDIAGRFSPAEYEETQVGLFGGDFYDGDATFLTREQVDQHLEDMGIDGGLESKRTDDAESEGERIHGEAMEQLREIFAEVGSEQAEITLDQVAYLITTPGRGIFGGPRAAKPEYLQAIRELVEERDPDFMEELAETLRIRQTTEGYRRLTESGLDSGVGVHGRETTTAIRGIFDGHINDGDPITLYHGGPVDLTGDVDYEVSRNDSGQWGPGIYTTASAFPAIKGWANPWQRNAEGGYDTADPGHLHTTRWKGENPPRILDVMDPLPDNVLDQVAIPATKALLSEIKDISPAVRKDNWKVEYLEEELEGLLDFIARKRGEATGPETLLQLQKYMQEGDVGYMRGEGEGFLPSDRLDLIRNRINASIGILGYDVIKSHEAGIREMSRTDYMFLDPDMVEFVEVATTHSLAGFGNQGGARLTSLIRDRVKAREVDEGGLKSQRFDQRDIGMEGVGPVRTGANGELVRDIELPNGNTVEVDASMAPRIKRMNDAGYLTAQAGSGNPEDYPEGSGSHSIEAGTGYISLYKAQLDDEKIDDLRRAAAEAGLSFEDDGDVFFEPAVSVRTAMMADGTPYFGPDGIHQQSNALAAEELGVEWPDTEAIVRGLRPSLTPEENTDFYRLIDKRDEINPRLKAEHGGQISAEEGQRRWAKFEDALLGEAHDLSHYTALDASTADEEGFIPGRDRMEAEMNADPDGLRSKRDSRAERVARLADPDWDTYYGEETQRVADALGIDVVDPRYPHPGAVRTLYDYGRKENEVELVPIEFFDDMPGNVGAAASNDGNDDAYALAGEIREFESDPTQRHLAQQPQTELVKSVRAVGILSALIGHYDFETGDLSLGEGNHRLAAAREVGMTVVPIRFSQMRGRRKEAGARKRIQTLSANKWGDPMLPDGHRLRDEGLTELPSTFKPSDIGIPTHDLPEFPELKKLRKDRRDVVDENLARRNELRSRATQEALDGGSTRQEASAAGDAAWQSEKDRWLSSPVDEGSLRSRRTDALSALEEGRYHLQIGFPDPVDRPESRQPLWDVRGKLAASHLADVDLMELETYHSLLGKYLERRQTVSDTYQRLWRENDIQVSGYPTWVTDRLYHRPLDTPTKTTLPVRYTRPGMEDPNETSPTLRPAGRIAHAEKMQARLVEDFFARHLGEDWRDTNPDTRLMPDGTRGKFGKTAITFASTGLNYSETLELFEQAELLATHHDTFKKHWQKNFDDLKEHAKTSIAVRQVRRAHARSAADAGEEAEFDLGVTLYMPGNDNFRGAVSTDHIAMVNMLEDMLLVSGHGPLSESQVELLGNASEIVLLEHQKYTETNTLTMDRVGDKTVPYESLDTLHEEWHKYDEDAVVVTVPMQMRRKVKRAGIAHIANHLTPEENDAIDAAFGTAGAGDSDAFAAGNVSFLLQAIHKTWAHQSAGYASKSLILQQVMARNLGWDDQKIADDLFHGVDTSGVFGHEDMDVLAPSMARGGITYSEIKERAAAVIESLGDSMLTNVDDRSGRIHIRRDSATGNWIAQDTTTGETWEAPDLEQIERITGLTAAAEDVARDEGISLEEAQEIVNNATGIRPRVKSVTLGLTFRESAEPFEQLDRRIGLLLDDLDADSVAEEVRLGRELLELRRKPGALLTAGERHTGITELLSGPNSLDIIPESETATPRDLLFALKDVLPFTPEKLRDGATMAEAKRIKKAYERVRAHRAARDNARHMVTALVYEHYVGDAFKAALAAERRTTAARLKEMGIETIPLYRGFTLGKDDADSLLSALGDTGALYDDYMMPLTAWSTSKETAKTFGTLHQGANEPDLTGFVVRSDVSVDDIVGLSTHGFGCISEGECVVGHGERHLTIEAVY